jgi:pimeloyl-ACP methyl ester carboxylesterase
MNIPTRHGNTFVIACGNVDLPPLVLLHGSGSNAASWAGDVSEYSRYFRVYAVDILGEPGKSAPNRLPWRGPGYGEWMEDILDNLKVHRASLLGLSLGGWMALKYDTHNPERVDKLVLLAPGGIVPANASFLVQVIVYSMLGRRGAKAISRLVFGKQPVHPEAEHFLNVILTNFKPRMDSHPMFTDQELTGLTMPVLVIAGARDRLFASQKIVARLRKQVPRLESNLLPEASHALIMLTSLTLPFLTS